MTSAETGAIGTARPKAPLIHNPKVRSIVYQALLCALIVFLAWGAIDNAAENLARAKIASGFGFWDHIAGFDISQTLIDYSSTSSYGRAFWVGLINTLLVATLGIVLATVLGFVIGIARLSKNWLLARMAGGYVEIIRNLPLLLQLLFWYNAVLKALPELRDSLVIPGGGFLNNRGLFLPQPVLLPGARWTLIFASTIRVRHGYTPGLRLSTTRKPAKLAIGSLIGSPLNNSTTAFSAPLI